jgi:hypothetical protein
MWSEFFSTKAKGFMNYFFSKQEKNAILDPFSCMVRIAILFFKPKGTKISFANNKISYHEPCLLQGTIRSFQGDNREDLHNLFQPIKKAMIWYDYKDKQIEAIFKLSEKGIAKLQNSYTYNSLITHSLEHYRQYITSHLNGSRQQKTQNDQPVDDKNIIFQKLRDLWSENEINIIYNILIELKASNKDSAEPLIMALESILSHKENKVNDIIIQHTTILE